MPKEPAAAASKVCEVCEERKDVSEYKISRDGAYYPTCWTCFVEHSRLNDIAFWKDKRNRKCGVCKESVPLSLYAKDSYGIPFRNCKSCDTENAERAYYARIAAKRKDDGAEIADGSARELSKKCKIIVTAPPSSGTKKASSHKKWRE